mmetsp:Transcript_112064/g.219685  ORF Transcript_112064/g.219685 Transcript_112064/m.219685 type:complete len:236 (-) Transcript_112064:118-825(-)
MVSKVEDVVQAFKSWDVDGTGIITKKELSDLIRTLAPQIMEDDLDRLFDAAASDGLRVDDLKYEEFLFWLWSTDAMSQGDGSASTPAEDGIDEEARRRGLWEGAVESASSNAMARYPPEKVRRYFNGIVDRLRSKEYCDHVKGAYFESVDANRDGKVSFAEAEALIAKSLRCAADLLHIKGHPTAQEIRAAFDAHDTLVAGRGMMGVDEFLNLMRYLQVRVAEAALPLSSFFSEP